MNVWPATVSVPVRELVPVLAVADHETVPPAVPLAGVQVSQLVAALEAVQAQLAPAVTLTVPVAAAAPGLALVDEIV